jgi:hypothetical protein
MKTFRNHVCALLLASLAAFSAAGADEHATAPKIREISPPHYVLLFGNSFSFYNNGMHTFLREMFRERADEKEKYVFRIITVSGGYLQDAGASFDHAVKRQYKWDTVIFQGNSDEPINAKKRDDFAKYANELAGKAHAAKLQPVFFATWAYPDKPQMTGQLMEAYTRVANETDAMVSPVGIAFAEAVRDKPEIVLIMPDKRHPTVAGSYLAACTLYASMAKKSPEGLKYDAGLGAETATFLQQAAWRAVKGFYGW